jgi:two-component system CheB/CheR fusion protein
MFEILETQVIPELLRDKPADEPLRVWVPACATGEEAYSLAMIFLEQIAASGKACPLQVFASDVEPEALDAARRGVYADSVLADVGGSRLARFFTRADPNHYQVNKTLRDAVLFAQQNILSDAPFSRIDLLSCRNFLIYLESEIQQKVVSLMHFALNEGGYLVLGPSESTATHAGLFEPVSKKWRIYRSLGAGRPVRPELPAEFYASNGSGARPQAPERVPGGIVPEELVRQELLADAPASVLRSCISTARPTAIWSSRAVVPRAAFSRLPRRACARACARPRTARSTGDGGSASPAARSSATATSSL